MISESVAAPHADGRASVRLSVHRADATVLEYAFTERTTAIAGRASDCDPRLDASDSQVSRHHCLFDVNPPDLRVRDLGSLNGTFVNGDEIGRRRPGQTPEEGARLEFRERDLADGDEVRIGRTVLRVAVTVPTSKPTPKPTPKPVTKSCQEPPRPDRADGDAQGSIGGYDLLSVLGRGGQGIVYLARRPGERDLVALKVLRPDRDVTEHARDSFLREIAHTRALRHPNLVRFRDSGTTGDLFYLVSEYCEGGSVAALRGPDGTADVDVERAVRIALDVLEGLHHAHNVRLPDDGDGPGGVGSGVGVVHRDIKPANILLAGTRADAPAKLGDFGLTKAFDRAGLSGHTRTGAVAGTVAFMARPQLVNYRDARPEVDVWATAASLYWMLTGQAPREFPYGRDPLLVVLHEPAVPIRQRRPDLPRALAAAIDAALVDNPAITVGSAVELADALRASS